jgi:hypothetical protein
MFTVLLNVIYNYQEKEINESIILLSNFNTYLVLKILLWFRKSSLGTYRGNNFLIDGKKINSKKNLYTTINNINYNFTKNKKKTAPFVIIMIINLDYIPLDNQTIFKNFLDEKGMILKFFFYANDLDFLDKSLVEKCTIISSFNSVFNKKNCQKFWKLHLRKADYFRNTENIEFLELKKKILNYYFYFEKKFDKKILIVRNVFFKILKNISNEIFCIFTCINFFKKFKKLTTMISWRLLIQLKNYIKDYSFYLKTSPN